MRFVKKFVLALVILLICFVIHVFISTGYFREIENKFDGTVVKRIALPGSEDITISLKDSFAIVSSTKRSFATSRLDGKGGLYYLELKSGNFEFSPLTNFLQKPFSPHGISMIESGNAYKVMAINHSPKGHSIEVFGLKNKEMTFVKSLTNASMISPNDIVMIDENKFYFTNDHGYTKGIGNFLEDYAGLSASNVIYFDGKNYREVANGISYANGINYDSDRSLLYVSSVRKFLIKVYSVQLDGSLFFIENIKCGTGIDNIEIDKDGNLWMGAHPSLLAFSAYSDKKEAFSPSEIIKISYRAKKNYSIEKIYLEEGKLMSGASVAAPFGDLILLGNVKDDGFLILKRNN